MDGRYTRAPLKVARPGTITLTDTANAKPTRADLSPLSTLRPYMAAHRRDGLLAGLFMLCSSGATLGLTFALRGLADHGLASHAAHDIDTAFLSLAGVAVFLAIATSGRFYFVTRFGERVVADLRTALYRHVLTLDPTTLTRLRTGEILSRITTDLTLVEALVGATISVALRNVVTVTASLVVMVVVSPSLTAFVGLLALVIILPLAVVGRRVRSLSTRAQASFGEAVAFAGETLEGMETVQAFGRERTIGDRFASAIETAFRRSMSRAAARMVMTALVMILVFGGVGLILWRASLAAFVTHRMTPGTLLQFVFLSVLAGGGVGSLGEAWGEVQKCAGAMARVNEALGTRSLIVAPAAPRALPSPARGAIAFRNVRFAYPGHDDRPVLEDFNLEIAPGERVAVVGSSGAGKSTLFRLILRFYDPQAGEILLDGVDLRNADPSEVRARMALVAQDATLFSGSAIDNLRLGDETASQERISQAVSAARSDDFLLSRAGGLEAPLGERARALSGGQRQRLAIARALLKNAPILLLDEATSALDAETERDVQAALDEAMRGRTTLVIAHRLATVRSADRIVVMDEGRVVEVGAHDALAAQGGLYARLALLQFGGELA